jgi:hypothetical protein
MEKLRKTLIKITNDFAKKDDILLEEYKSKDLFKIWKNTIAGAPARLSKSWNRLLTALQTVLKLWYKNPSTFNGIVSKFREPIRNNPRFDDEIYKQSLIILGRTQQEAKQQSEDYANRVKARNAARGDNPVLYVEDVFNVMDKLIVSNDPYEITLAVELATASRSIEVFKVSKYFAIDGQPDQIKVVGLAKDKGNNNLKDVVIVKNLVHLNSQQVIDAVEIIRSSFNFESKSNVKITSMTNRGLNKAFKKHIVPLFVPQDPLYLKTLTSHKTRYISGYISYLVYGKPKKIPENSYIQEQLGHLSGESTKSYLGINIQFKQKVIEKASHNFDQNCANDIKSLFENEIKQIKQQIERNCPDVLDTVDLTEYKNSNRRGMSKDEKVDMVVKALDLLKKNKIKIPQRQLRQQLGYAAAIMTDAYKLARERQIL